MPCCARLSARLSRAGSAVCSRATSRTGGSGPSGLLRLASGEPTAFYAAFGGLLAEQLEATGSGLRCRVRTTAGSITNIELLPDGRADLGLVLTDTARAARGTGPFPRPVPLRAIGRVCETYLQVPGRPQPHRHRQRAASPRRGGGVPLAARLTAGAVRAGAPEAGRPTGFEGGPHCSRVACASADDLWTSEVLTSHDDRNV
ncbi:TAXI family TRAP transporter solute-binding subunit [Streptomyces olivaceus]|uniref:TAXI family TRAP transporter solute-binding subunit n=1 Tax=Streptomyces olivaceus TaxID=47716 RepID=UPI0033AD1BA5